MGRKKTRYVLTAALRAQHPSEARALEHVQQGKDAGFTVSQIIVDALNRAAGMTPEMFSREGLDAQSTLLAETIRADLIEQLEAVKRELLREFARLLLDELQNRQIITAEQKAALTTPAADRDDTFVDALIGGLAANGRLRKREVS